MTTRVLSFDLGTKNLGLCDLTVESDGSFQIHDWSVETTVDPSLNVNKTPLWDIAPMFFEYVKKHSVYWLFDISDDGHEIPGYEGRFVQKPFSHVLIENQPMGGKGSARNLKTKVLSHILQVYILTLRPDVKVSFIHPGIKLKNMIRPVDGTKTSYRENKKHAIDETERLLQSESCKTKNCPVWSSKKKRDDLGDCFLQGLIVGQLISKGDFMTQETTKVKKISKDVPRKSRKRTHDQISSECLDIEIETQPTKRPTKNK